jgi:DNA-binding NtrC family response regulator
MTDDRDRILVVDDERDMAESCAFLLDRAGYETKIAFSGPDALAEMARQTFSLVITDLRMPRMSGLALLDEVKARDPDVEVLLITGFPEIESAVAAIKRGAWDYITKPFVEPDLIECVENALAHHRVKLSNEGLKQRLRMGVEGRRLIYRSKLFSETVEILERAARTDASVLIQGESGTGKELLAHRLHDASARADRPFVPVDCTTIPENLVESELFGHVKGAFSGAYASKAGLFQIADGGTLFLDEVGELSLGFQAKLLRVIQERQIRKVGGEDFLPVDLRIVCSTNRRLSLEVQAGRFRQDLFYRLDVVRIQVPALRERPDDVELLAEHFRAEFSARYGGRIDGFAPDVLPVLQVYSWPGNVRQLRNVIERACALSRESVIQLRDLPDELRNESSDGRGQAREFSGTWQEMKARQVAAIESSYVEQLLARHGGHVTHCAEEAGMSRSAFQKLMQRYNIKSRDYRQKP